MKIFYPQFFFCTVILFTSTGCVNRPSFSGENSVSTAGRIVDYAGNKYIDSCGGMAPNVSATTQTIIIWARPSNPPGSVSHVTQPSQGLNVPQQSVVCKVNYKILEHNSPAQAGVWVQDGRTRYSAVACNGFREVLTGIKVMICPYVTSRDAANQPNSGCTPIDNLYIGSDAPRELICN